jgi:hypothetical protein
VRVDWVSNAVEPDDPCIRPKNTEGLCIQATMTKDIVMSTRDEVDCPLCGSFILPKDAKPKSRMSLSPTDAL